MPDHTITAIPVNHVPEIYPKDEVGHIILEALKKSELQLEEADIFVIASKVISKAEGRVVTTKGITLSNRAEEIAKRNGFDSYQVEFALRESKRVLRDERVLITEMHSGLICNFAGVDRSNVPEGSYVLLPKEPDYSAEQIRSKLRESSGKEIAVIIADTQGRPWRKGSVNLAIGCAGISPFKYNRGKQDLYGRALERSTVCHVDELAALAEPLMGQAGQGTPVVIIRGYTYTVDKGGAIGIIRSEEENLFI